MQTIIDKIDDRVRFIDEVINEGMKHDGNYHGDCSPYIMARHELLAIREHIVNLNTQPNGNNTMREAPCTNHHGTLSGN